MGTILQRRLIRGPINPAGRPPFSKMNTNKKGITTTSFALVIALVFALTATIPATEGSTTTITSTLTYPPLTMQAGGSTFVNPVMQVWATNFAGYSSGAVNTNYQALGSGAGITGILKNTFEFAGSDAPVPASQSANYTATLGPLLQIPETLGGVAIFYNIPGVSVSLNLTGPIIAKIFLGTITMWNDPAIAALNPGCQAGSQLPASSRATQSSRSTGLTAAEPHTPSPTTSRRSAQTGTPRSRADAHATGLQSAGHRSRLAPKVAAESLRTC